MGSNQLLLSNNWLLRRKILIAINRSLDLCSVYLLLFLTVDKQTRRTRLLQRNLDKIHWANWRYFTMHVQTTNSKYEPLSHFPYGQFRCNFLLLRSSWYVLLEVNAKSSRWNGWNSPCSFCYCIFPIRIRLHVSYELFSNGVTFLLSSLHRLLVTVLLRSRNMDMVNRYRLDNGSYW